MSLTKRYTGGDTGGRGTSAGGRTGRGGALVAVLALTVAAGAGCPPSGPRYHFDPNRYDNLPDDPVALVKLADALIAPGSRTPRRLDRALAALEVAAREGHPRPFEVRWRQARAAFLMTEVLKNRDQRLGFGRTGRDFAAQAVRLDARRVEGHYYLALNAAKVAEAANKMKLIKPMIRRMQKAEAIDPAYDDAGPLRFLGKVYLTAPAWPVSVGDPGKAVTYLERAVDLSPHPMNRIFLGQAYLADEEYEEALPHLRRGLAEGRAEGLDRRWLEEATESMRVLCEERLLEQCTDADRAAGRGLPAPDSREAPGTAGGGARALPVGSLREARL